MNYRVFKYALYAVLAVAMALLARCSVSSLFPLLDSSNVNQGRLAVHAVWWNPVNDYHNDTILHTLFTGRTVLVGENSWYKDYVLAFADKAVIDPHIGDMGPQEAESLGFRDLGFSFASIHSTLVQKEVQELAQAGEVPHIWVNPAHLQESGPIAVWNDDRGNLYVGSSRYAHE